MPRKAREQSSTGIYHVMLRGINGQQIFEDDEDNETFLTLLGDCKQISRFKLYGYCLMGNHVHLLIKTTGEGLSQIFKRIGVRYVYWYNRKYQRSGHLFQDRFKSEPVEDEKYFQAVLRYIHQNPVRAGLVDSVKEYSWSSYNDYMKTEGITDTSFALKLMSADEFIRFSNAENNDCFLDEKSKTWRMNDADAKDIILKLFGVDNVSAFQSFSPNERNDNIKKLLSAGLSIRQISRLTGVSKRIVEKCGK